MVSPSSTAITRKVPCIAGCDGPMFTSMRSNMSSSSPATLSSRPTYFGLYCLSSVRIQRRAGS